jgi:hypothetical protein
LETWNEVTYTREFGLFNRQVKQMNDKFYAALAKYVERLEQSSKTMSIGERGARMGEERSIGNAVDRNRS